MAAKVFYGAKLFDPRWKEKRIKILQRDQHKCTICQATDVKLQVHHKQYHFIKRLEKHVEPWDYSDHLLVTLCKDCHDRGHKLYEIPTKYI